MNCKSVGVTPDHGRCIDDQRQLTEAESIEPSETASAKSVDDRLIDELVGRAQTEGLQLTTAPTYPARPSP